jgi:hypothetical protein
MAFVVAQTNRIDIFRHTITFTCPMPPSKASITKQPASNHLEIAEVKRKLQHPFTSLFDKAYLKGKLIALQSDKTTKWQHGTRQQTAMTFIQSTDIFDRAKAIGMLHDDPAFAEGSSAVEWTNYTLKG